jgi:hypothetical protein
MVGHVKLAVVSMTRKFGTFLLFLFRRLLWSRNYLFVYFEMLRLSELVGLHADTKLFYCVYVQMAN